jgi:hypothetical protein
MDQRRNNGSRIKADPRLLEVWGREALDLFAFYHATELRPQDPQGRDRKAMELGDVPDLLQRPGVRVPPQEEGPRPLGLVRGRMKAADIATSIVIIFIMILFAAGQYIAS